MYSCEEEYNEAMSGAAEADMMAQMAKDIYKEINVLEQQKYEVQKKIDDLYKLLP